MSMQSQSAQTKSKVIEAINLVMLLLPDHIEPWTENTHDFRAPDCFMQIVCVAGKRLIVRDALMNLGISSYPLHSRSLRADYV